MFHALTQHFRSWREWELNPVVVKELRQAVRSWSVTGMLLLFLAVLFCTSLVFLVGQSFNVSVNQRLGAEIFQVFAGILCFASMLFIPLYVGIRLAAERTENNLDLLYITSLSPARIIRGKFLCGAYMAVLFFSACMPFMAFTNLLRGVDLPTVAFILLCLFIAVCCATQVAIFIACLPVSRVLKILVGLASFCALIPASIGLVALFFNSMRSGIGSMLALPNFWVVFLSVTALILACVILLYFLSVAMISPLSANRAVPLRSYVTVFWLIAGVIAFYWALRVRFVQPIIAWAIGSLVLLAASTVVVISNNDQLSVRVRRKIPRTPLKSALAFLFFNGAAGGLTWVAALIGITLGVTYGAFQFLPEWKPSFRGLSPDDLKSFRVMTSAWVLYLFAYALTALFLHRQLFARRSPRIAGILALILPAAWALAPQIALFFFNRLSFLSLERLQLGNVFNVAMVRNYEHRVTHLVCAAAWLALMLALNARWFSRQVKAFRPLDSTLPSAIHSVQMTPPPLPTESGAAQS